MLAQRLHQLNKRIGALSIRTKTFAALAILLSCFAVLGINSYVTMRTTSDKLGVLRAHTLPEQTVVMDFANDVIATHMKVFRFVTLASNGVSRKLLDSVRAEVLSELDGETGRLKALADRRASFNSGTRELALITTTWSLYVGGVRDLLDVGRTDAPMAAMMLGATDEDFQTIATHLSALSSLANERTAALASDILVSVDANRLWLAFGGTGGMIISVFVAMGFARSFVRPIVAVTHAMQKVSCGAVDVAIGYQERKDEIGQMVEAISTFRRTTQLHAETIATQNRRFDVTLNHMSHGLCMFDADGTLIVRNNRYLEIYRMPPGSLEPGCTLPEVMQSLADAGVVSGDQAQYVADLRSALAQGRSLQSTRELSDGRSVHIFNQPMPGGGWVATHEDVTERIKSERRAAYIARHDILTGLPNRFHFRERAEQALPRLRRGENFAVLCIDLDHFKEVNDTLGHPSGDRLLKLVAERLRQCVRETDIVARLGGDEFAVIQTAIQSPEEVTSLARRIVETLIEPYDLDGHEVRVGTSIGVAIAPGDGNDPDQLLKSADMALYRAKADGRGMVRFFEAEMDVRIQARHKLEIELRRAVAHGEFAVHYQPIIDLRANRVAAFEALVRWNHPERGVVMPDGFVSVAEDIGLIAPIGEWVLHRACAEAATWPRDIRVAVNLSPSQFRKTLVATVVHALESSGLSAGRLELEITESVLLQNSETTMSMLRQLHDIGVIISMDDFGTGYSSLSYLHSFPFDKIKIDQSFVNDLGANSNCAAIVKAVTGLGRTLGMKTTAEGVETREQLEWLRSEGCTEVQGYFFSRARHPEELAELIAEIDRRLADQPVAA
jgi:diguanylate cyclase (GGDEF)-like protein